MCCEETSGILQANQTFRDPTQETPSANPGRPNGQALKRGNQENGKRTRHVEQKAELSLTFSQTLQVCGRSPVASCWEADSKTLELCMP
jgi:hypothetical protein